MFLGLILLTTVPKVARGEASSEAGVSSANPESLAALVSGHERQATEGGRTAARTFDAVTYVPRALVGAVFTGLIFAETRATDARFISRLTDLTYLYDRRLTWHPVFWFATGSSPGIGANLNYRTDTASIGVGGVYSTSDRWVTQLNINRTTPRESRVRKVSFKLQLMELNEIEFFGFGADPKTDERNVRLVDSNLQEAGFYGQRVNSAGLVAGVRTSDRWQIFATGLYRRRETGESDAAQTDNLDDVFASGTVPRFGSVEEQFYTEISAEVDTRQIRTMMSPGLRTDGYIGVSLGVNGDKARFLRAGFDTAFFLPVIKRNRLMHPRLVVNYMKSLNNDAEISFADYPRHRKFRGASRDVLLRTDFLSLVPSLSYQWPLSHLLRMTLFGDYLFVGRSVSNLTIRNAPYAYGADLALVIDKSVVTSILLATGSEGIRFSLRVGFGFSDDRSRWN